MLASMWIPNVEVPMALVVHFVEPALVGVVRIVLGTAETEIASIDCLWNFV